MDSGRIRRDRRRLFHCLKPPSTVDYEETVSLSHDRYECGPKSNKKSKPRQSSGLKAVFMNSFLGKKFRTNKSRKLDSCQPSNDIVGSPKDKMKKKKKSSYSEFSDAEQVFTSSNSSSTGSTRSSISSSSLGSERHLYLDSKEFNKQLFESTAETSQMTKVGRKSVLCSNSIRIWCMFMLVVCLFALVFGGKPFAILTCTSTCLFFAPRSKRVNLDLLLVDEATCLNEYKKRVIMEGMLVRNRGTPVS